MLSRLDIIKELGKGFAIYPFQPENIKENSVNLSLSTCAWAVGGGEYYVNNLDECYSKAKGTYNERKRTIASGKSTVIELDKMKKIILFPHQTTVVETKEVVAVSDYIGGALHSKVGIVALGIGHIGTMLGPGYCGHLMISLHNISDEVVLLDVGETFVSITLEYLETPVSRTSTTISGHVDKLSELGIKIDTKTREYLTADWKSTFEGVSKKMVENSNYVKYIKEQDSKKYEYIKSYITIKNVFIVVFTMAILVILYATVGYMDKMNGNTTWTDRFWNVGLSGILVVVISNLIKLIKPRNRL